MCKAPKVSEPSTPAPSTPAPSAPPPPPAQPAASAADIATSKEVRDENIGEGTNMKAKKRGRNALRIDLQAGGAGSGGTGLNIPRA